MKQAAPVFHDSGGVPAHAKAVVIGIDSAVNPRNVALALGSWTGKTVQVEDVIRGSARPPIAETIESWIRGAPGPPVLLALDAPLGWPAPLTETLASHRPGQGLAFAAHEMFRRRTDDFVHERVGKRPLDVYPDLPPLGRASEGD